MKNKKGLSSFLILIFNIIIPSLKAENIFDGNYKSEFLLPFNRTYTGDMKCPKKLPIKVQLTVKGNEITGNISNSSKCPNYQRAQINGEIDEAGNIVKIKFDHYDKKWGPKDDVYKIEGNLNNKLILKSKQKRMYKNHIFFLTSQNSSNRIDKFIYEGETNNLNIENEFSDESKKQQTEEIKEKQLRDQREKQLRESQEKQLRDQQEKQLRESQEKQLRDQQEKQLKEQKKIKKESNLLFN